MLQLRLNPGIDVEKYAHLYAQRKRVQVPELFEPAAAAQLESALLQLPWRIVCQDDSERTILLDNDRIAALSAAARQQLNEGIRDRARRGIGYTYLGYPMITARIEDWDPGHPIHALTDFLNSPEFIAFARRIIDCPGVNKVDAHASNYQPGHFLTRHQDDGELNERRAAYTIGFSRNWQPDWGGLLLFLDDKFDVIDGFLPRFNVLTVFDGMMLHAVTSVAAFTPAPRLSIAGWFRDDPIVQR